MRGKELAGARVARRTARLAGRGRQGCTSGRGLGAAPEPQFPGQGSLERRPLWSRRAGGPTGGASHGGRREGGARGRAWRPRPRGPQAETRAGGGRRGGRAESFWIDPPAASRGGGDSGPGTGGRSCPPRRGTAGRRRAGQRPAGLGRGAPIGVRGRRAEGTRARETRRAAGPAPPLPRGTWGAGLPRSPRVHRQGRPRGVPGGCRGRLASSQGDADVGFLMGSTRGSFHSAALPLGQ